MASKRRLRRQLARTQERQCGDKERLTHAEAKGKAGRVTYQTGERMGSYKCPHCGAWHIGHVTILRRRKL